MAAGRARGSTNQPRRPDVSTAGYAASAPPVRQVKPMSFVRPKNFVEAPAAEVTAEQDHPLTGLGQGDTKVHEPGVLPSPALAVVT